MSRSGGYILFISFTVAVLIEISLQWNYGGTTSRFSLSQVPHGTGFCITDPNIERDSIIGYRFRQESRSRYAYFVDGRREIDFVMKVNNSGVPSHIDFHPQKDSVSQLRYLVFGDSFSAGVLMDTTWADHVNTLAEQRGIPIQLHNHSIDGGGMSNWYSVFRNGLEQGYEYDGVILAIYLDNLNRMFVSWWDDGDCVRGNYFDAPPSDSELLGECCFNTFPGDEFERLERDYFSGDHTGRRPFPMTLALLHGEVQWGDPYERGQRKYYSQYIDKGSVLPFSRLSERYDPTNLARLDTMVNMLMSDGKEVIIAIIPDRYVVERKRDEQGFIALYEADIQEIASHYSLSTVINGNDAFLRFGSDSLRAMWLTGDMHWNAHGARAFSQIMADRLSRVSAETVRE